MAPKVTILPQLSPFGDKFHGGLIVCPALLLCSRQGRKVVYADSAAQKLSLTDRSCESYSDLSWTELNHVHSSLDQT